MTVDSCRVGYGDVPAPDTTACAWGLLFTVTDAHIVSNHGGSGLLNLFHDDVETITHYVHIVN